MKLLQNKVITLPGEEGVYPTGPITDKPLKGSVIVRLTNSTQQENAYKVAIRSNHPFWQGSWYSLTALARDPKSAGVAGAGKEDWYGSGKQTVRLFVARGESRDILVRFKLPQLPEARAGIFKFVAVIETDVSGTEKAVTRGRDIEQVDGSLVVKPFYSWRIDAQPDEQRVGRMRNHAQFDLVVTNQSNDWLYCAVQIPKNKDLTVETATLRLALPPAKPDDLLPAEEGQDRQQGIKRALPITATSKLKIIKGNLTPQPLSVTAQRLDAPSFPPVSEDPYSTPPTFVLVNTTTETKSLTDQRSLVYNPPIPNRPFEIFGRTFGSLKNFVMAVVGLAVFAIILYHGYIWAKEQQTFGVMKLDIKTTETTPGGTVRAEISPAGVAWAHQLVKNAMTLELFDSKGAPIQPAAKWSIIPDSPDRIAITIPASCPIGQITVKPQIAYSLKLLQGLPGFLQIPISSTAPLEIDPNKMSIAPAQVKAGQSFTVAGTDMGTEGTVNLNSTQVTTTSWSATSIQVSVPQGVAPGQYNVNVIPTGTTTPLNAGVITVGNAPPSASTVQTALTALTTGNVQGALALPAQSSDPDTTAIRAAATAQQGAQDAGAELSNAQRMANSPMDHALIDCAQGLTLEGSGNYQAALNKYVLATNVDGSLTFAYIGAARAIDETPLDPNVPIDQAKLTKLKYEITALHQGYVSAKGNDQHAAILNEGKQLNIDSEYVESGAVPAATPS